MDDSGIKEVAIAPKEYLTNTSLITSRDGFTNGSKYQPSIWGVDNHAWFPSVDIDFILPFIDVNDSRMDNKSVMIEKETSEGLSRIIGGAVIIGSCFI